MKKIIFLALASLALVGCKNDNVKKQNKSNDINFATQIGIARATESTTANLDKFKVYVQEPATSGTAGYTDYFNTVVTKNATTSKWEYTPTKPWKGTSVLHFYGFAPSDLNYNSRAIEFTPAAQAKDQKDFIVSNLASAKAAKATMNFKHALSQIIVKAKNTGDKYKVEIGAIRLTNFYNKNTLTIKEAVASTSSTAATIFDWAAATTAKPIAMTKKFFASNGDIKTIDINTAEAESLDFGQNAFMVIPQDLSGANTWVKDKKEAENNKKARLSFLIRVTSPDGKDLYYPAQKTQMGWGSCPINTKFEPGKRYTITLDFANGAGFQDPDDDGGDGDVKKPVEPTPNPGDDHNTPVVSSNDIIFDVVVGDWEDGDAINISL